MRAPRYPDWWSNSPDAMSFGAFFSVKAALSMLDESTELDEAPSCATGSYSFKKDGMVFAANFTFTALRDLEDIQAARAFLGGFLKALGVASYPHNLSNEAIKVSLVLGYVRICMLGELCMKTIGMFLSQLRP